MATARAEARRLFDLERGPLWRARLMLLAPREHALIVTAHHAVCDEPSLRVLIEDLVLLYRGHALGSTQPAIVPLAQYTDFCAWEEAFLRSEAAQMWSWT